HRRALEGGVPALAPAREALHRRPRSGGGGVLEDLPFALGAASRGLDRRRRLPRPGPAGGARRVLFFPQAGGRSSRRRPRSRDRPPGDPPEAGRGGPALARRGPFTVGGPAVPRPGGRGVPVRPRANRRPLFFGSARAGDAAKPP